MKQTIEELEDSWSNNMAEIKELMILSLSYFEQHYLEDYANEITRLVKRKNDLEDEIEEAEGWPVKEECLSITCPSCKQSFSIIDCPKCEHDFTLTKEMVGDCNEDHAT